MRAAIVAISALIGITACNRQAEKGKSEGSEAVSKTEEEARKAGEEIKEGAEKAADKTKKEADKAAVAVEEGAKKTEEKTEEAAHDTKESAEKMAKKSEAGAEKAGTKTKEEAARAAMITKALVGGDYGKTDADKEKTQKIREEIKKEKSIPETDKDVAIKTMDGNVTLTGTVTSAESKKEIEKIAKGVAGKKKVKDEIKLAEKVGTGPSD